VLVVGESIDIAPLIGGYNHLYLIENKALRTWLYRRNTNNGGKTDGMSIRLKISNNENMIIK